MNPVFLFLEVAATVLFIGAALAALRRGRLPFLELISAAVFGLLLEEGDQLIFQTYHYSPDWILVIDRAPVVIGLTWALLIAGAMRITDALGVRRWTAPFVDAVLVIMLDLAFDAVAIRMGMWTWVGVGPDQGWFGVPAGNFYAWLFVTLGFSLLSRWLRDISARRPALEWLQLGVPIPAFAILITSIVPFAMIMELTDAQPGGGLWLFGLTLAVFVAIAGLGDLWPRPPAPRRQGQRHRRPAAGVLHPLLDARVLPRGPDRHGPRDPAPRPVAWPRSCCSRPTSAWRGSWTGGEAERSRSTSWAVRSRRHRLRSASRERRLDRPRTPRRRSAISRP